MARAQGRPRAVQRQGGDQGDGEQVRVEEAHGTIAFQVFSHHHAGYEGIELSPLSGLWGSSLVFSAGRQILSHIVI